MMLTSYSRWVEQRSEASHDYKNLFATMCRSLTESKTNFTRPKVCKLELVGDFERPHHRHSLCATGATEGRP